MLDNDKKRQPKSDIKYSLSLTDEQKIAKQQILESTVVFLLGEAGTAKTFVAVSTSLDMVFKGLKSKIVITRPTVSTEDIGFLPGTFEEKMEPWLVPIRDNMRKFYNNPAKLKKMEEDGVIEIISLAHFRGRTMQDAVCIIDECFIGKTFVTTDRGKMTIANIFKEFVAGTTIKVLSYNELKQLFEYKPVIGASKTPSQNIVKAYFKDFTVRCTINHKILTTNGYKKIEDLRENEICIFNGKSNKSSNFINTDDTAAIVVGSLMGDGHCANLNNGVFRITYTHGIAQETYCKWKIELLGGTYKIIEKNGYAQKPAIRGQTESFMIDGFDVTDKKDIIANITWKSLAISWMDDGWLSKHYDAGDLWSFPLNKELTYLLSEKLNSMGVVNSVKYYNNYYKITITKLGVYVLSENIAAYTHESLAYKIHPDHRNLVGTYNWSENKNNYTVKPFTKFEYLPDSADVFDIEVADNHNFVVSSAKSATSELVVHNCQNLTYNQLKMALGRIGKGSIMIFCGDIDQIDLKQSSTSSIHAIHKLAKSKHVSIIELKENHRHPAVHDLLELLK